MNQKSLRKARSLKAKGWSLRDIASEIGCSHEGVRAALSSTPEPAAKLPAHMRSPKKPKRPPSAKQAASGTFLEVCRALLTELRQRARTTSHPTLRTRYSADATNLAGLVLRLETAEATRAEGLSITLAEVGQIQASLFQRMREHLERAEKAGKLVCSTCRCALAVDLNEPEPTPEPAPDASTAPPAADVDGMIAEARGALKWLLDSTADAEATGDEMSTQRAGRAAVSIAGFVARLEKALAKTRTDQIHIAPAEVLKAEGDIIERIAGIRNRPLMCARCDRAHSVHQGTGLSESELDATGGSEPA